MPTKAPARLTGRVSIHRDGYGFLIPAHPVESIDGDVFLPPNALRNAMNGDRVLVALRRVDRSGRAEGEVVRIVERANRTVVGTFHLRRLGAFVEPFDGRLRDWIEIPTGMELPPGGLAEDRIGAAGPVVKSIEDLDGMIVNAEIVEFPDKDEHAVGRVIEILGHPGDFGVDVEIIIRKYHIPHRFPPEVLEQAERVPKVITQQDTSDRRDFRDLDIVTIDGETARDFDDAIWVARLDNGNYALQVHIADVSHYVLPGTPIDIEAAQRGTSVYFPDRAVPMLPLELSTGICSLNPAVDRLAMSALLEIDHTGEVVAQEFCRSVIRSAERMTYTNMHLFLEGDPAQRERYARLTERFELARELAGILMRKRDRRGSIDFDLPEPVIEFDEEGVMRGITRSPRTIANRLIEEFMLAANEAVAAHIEASGADSIYRIHEPPDPRKVMEFEQVAAQFGVTLGAGAGRARALPLTKRHRDGRKSRKEIVLPAHDVKITSRQYQQLVAQVEGKPEERILSYLMLRSLKQARYSEENAGHFALAADCYTHFTSPIRRYPDLMVHRILGALLDGEQPSYTPVRLESISVNSSDTERRAADAERELVEWKKVNFMADRVGDDFPALILNIQKFGFFVELQDLFVEGLVPIDSLPGDRYAFQENTRKIVGARSRRQFSIGDRVTVRLDRVDAVARQLSFSLVEPAPAPKRRTPRKGRPEVSPSPNQRK